MSKTKLLKPISAIAIRSRYLIGLGLIALMSFAGFMVLEQAIKAESEFAYIINISGKQRMLSQRIALYASEYAMATNSEQAKTAKDEVQKALRTFLNGHNILTNTESDSSESEMGFTLNQIYFGESTSLDSRVREYINTTETLLSKPHNELDRNHPLIDSIIKQSSELLPDLDHAVNQYQWEAEKKLFRLELLDFIIFGSIIFILIAEVFIIFIPMEKSILLNQRELIEQKERAENSERIKSQFLANMSHEIRTPMNGIVGIAELMQRTELNERQQNFMNVITNSADSLMEIINDILDFSKIESGNMNFEEISFDLRTSLQEVVQLMGARANQKQLDLILDYPPVSYKHYLSDPGRIRQVISNLVSNAIKFTESGHILIKVDIDAGATSDTVTIRVEDTGIGIPEEKLETIFEEFVQADGSTTRKYGGTGLGLAISKRITSALGGNISVQSEPDKGSVFTVHLPLKHAETDTTDPAPTEQYKELTGLRVLIVDDNAVNRKVFRETLTHHAGVMCDEAPNAVTALEMLHSAQAESVAYDIALVDYLMDGMDGLELGKQIKSDLAIADIQLILLSSSAQKGDGKTFREAGFSGFLTKPVHVDLLFNVMLDVINVNDTLKTNLVTRHSVAERRNKATSRSHDMNSNATTILLAEDNSTNRFVVEMMLESKPFNLLQATNGLEAVEMYREHEQTIDLILMDISMPEMNGFEATAKIREIQQQSNRTIPIIALTAHALKEDRQKCLDAGMDDYVSKPFNEEQFDRILTTYLTPKAA